MPLIHILVATDADNAPNPLAYTISTAPKNGKVTVSGNKATYTPNKDVSGTDSFTFTAHDGKLGGSAVVTLNITPLNDAPTATPQARSVAEDGILALLLRGSDPEGDTLTYTLVTPPAHGTATLSGTTVTYTPTKDYNGADEFTFKVNDGKVDSTPVKVSLTVTPVNDRPTASAGAWQQKVSGAAVTLAGSGSDPDGDTLTYSWVQSSGSPTVALANANQASASFTAPTVATMQTLSFTLTVNDGKGGTASEKVDVLVLPTSANNPPSADAGADKQANERSAVILAGSGSDADSDPLTYSWVQSSGAPAIALANANQASASFTAPEVTADTVLGFRLTVNDGKGGISTDTVEVAVLPSNDLPTANAGADQSVLPGAAVTLTGSGTDKDGDTLNYVWEQLSDIELDDLTDSGSNAIRFTAPSVEQGTVLTFRLTVEDGQGGSASDTVDVAVANKQPGTTGRLNDTGITECGNASANAACPQAGFPGQDAETGRDATQATNNDADGHRGFSFTKLDANGKALPANASHWNCVKDNVTSLVWEVKQGSIDNIAGNSGLHDPDDSYTWYEPDNTKNGGFSGYQKPSDYNAAHPDNICHGHIAGDSSTWCNTLAYVQRVNTAGLCNVKSWRMPSVTELHSIVDASRSEPAIDTNYFPETREFYSSSTPYHDSGSIKCVTFSLGLNSCNGNIGAGFNVRLVSSGQ